MACTVLHEWDCDQVRLPCSLSIDLQIDSLHRFTVSYNLSTTLDHSQYTSLEHDRWSHFLQVTVCY